MMNTTMKVPPKQRLTKERIRRRWTQLEVADQIGTTPGNVSRWERGITSPGPYFRSKLCELFSRSAQELGLTWEESDDSLVHNTPASSSVAASFRDREDLLAQVLNLLQPDTPAALPSISTSSDPGGMNLP